MMPARSAAPARLERVGRDVVAVTGSDARSFLQSLLSQDLDTLTGGEGARSLLLQPQGKLVADLRVLVVDDGELWCDCEPGVGERLVAQLERFKIRVRADLELRHGWAELAVRGDAGAAAPELDELLRAAGAPALGAAPYRHVAWRGARLVRAAWPGAAGADVLGPEAVLDGAQRALLDAGARQSLAGEHETARIAAGIVRQGHDIDETTIAQEAGLERDAVSFTKGCFLGQELVCRIDARGHVNRFVRRVDFAPAADAPPAGTEVRVGGRGVGRITSRAPNAPLALASLRREIEPGAQVEAGGAVGVVSALKEDVH